MAVELTLDETFLSDDERAEEALVRAAQAWRAARARIESVDVDALTPVLRGEYYRMLARIGLWADARVGGDEPVGLDDNGDIIPLEIRGDDVAVG